jgi:hypothetical protein
VEFVNLGGELLHEFMERGLGCFGLFGWLWVCVDGGGENVGLLLSVKHKITLFNGCLG